MAENIKSQEISCRLGRKCIAACTPSITEIALMALHAVMMSAKSVILPNVFDA